MKLVIISHTPHHAGASALRGWEATVREYHRVMCELMGKNT
jgi:hypothetical protein